MHSEKWQFVTIKRADGQEDIGVYRFSTDLCHDYADFRALFNLS
jgi:superfamily I DNA and RNA helicase